MKTLLRRVCNAAMLLLMLGLSACATGQRQKIEHGFDVQIGPGQDISSLVVRYGDFMREFCGGRHGCKSGYGTFYGVYMPIQPEMKVNWKTSDGQVHEVRVPVLSKVKDPNRFRRLFLKFSGSNLLLEQGSFYSNPGLVGWEMAPIYP